MKTIDIKVPDVYLPIFSEDCKENILLFGVTAVDRLLMGTTETADDGF